MVIHPLIFELEYEYIMEKLLIIMNEVLKIVFSYISLAWSVIIFWNLIEISRPIFNQRNNSVVFNIYFFYNNFKETLNHNLNFSLLFVFL